MASSAPLLELRHQRVHLEHREPERVVRVRMPRLQRVILLANGGDHVRESLQRADHPLAQRRDAEQEYERDQHGQRELRANGEVAGPEQHERDDQRRQHRHQGDDSDLTLVRGTHSIVLSQTSRV